jgi:hypothetical protein
VVGQKAIFFINSKRREASSRGKGDTASNAAKGFCCVCTTKSEMSVSKINVKFETICTGRLETALNVKRITDADNKKRINPSLG